MMRPSLTAGERDYLGALSALAEQYEKKTWPRRPDPRRPHEKLTDLMEESGMTQAKLANLLGVKQPMVSLLLHGRRELTQAHILTLARHFAMEPGYFMRG
jgi:antitoxin component HigA of HigAB toxin-antitoxin module